MIIKSILDNDLYKFTMQSAVLKYRQHVPVTYKFINRRKEGRFTTQFLKALQYEIDCMSDLRATKEEIEWMKIRCPYLGDQFIEFLRNYRYDSQQVICTINDGELELTIQGSWETAILWEVPLMAIISELYFRLIDTHWEFNEGDQSRKAGAKLNALSKCLFADFGTRRRRSYATQDLFCSHALQENNCVGSSNVHFAHKYNSKPIGTMAHEWIMGISVLEGLRHANRHALKIWSKCFDGDLGIALTDTYSTDAFWPDFDGYLARLFDGVRHDSADPIEFGMKAIEHYRMLGIDPTTKTIVFSDGLDANQAAELEQNFRGKIRTSFGIGTHFTNDFGETSKPLNMVIKLWDCNNVPVVKLSDVPGKVIGDNDAVRVALWTFLGEKLN
jgi:nicotinate phosphoribosyltransferase